MTLRHYLLWIVHHASAEWMLVLLGFLSLIVILIQANEMRKATLAMRDNTRVMLEGLRPVIASKPHGDPTQTLLERGCQRVEMSLFNRGSTPAYEVRYESWIEVLPFPFKDFTSQADHHEGKEPMTLFPNHDSIIVNIPIRKGITEQQMAGVRKLSLYVCLRVRVEYRDFLSVKRFVNFGFYVMGTGLGFLPKYNDVGR